LLLWRARALCDVLVVGVLSDVGAKAYKDVWPAQNSEIRMRAVARLGFVDVVVPQTTTDPTDVLERFVPDMLIHGDDWDRLIEGHETIERLGVEWVLLPYTPNISSTKLREARP
jgi:glycerol-3-phosphate cytidylyltransferase